MAIRLRKISSNEKSLLQVTQRVEKRRTLWRKVRFLTVLLLLAIIAGTIIYARFYRRSGAVIVLANLDLLSSPGDAFVIWLNQQAVGSPVKPGDPLAKIKIRNGNPLKIQEELAQLKLERKRAEMMAAQTRADLAHDHKNISQEEVELKSTLEVAEDAVERGKVSLKLTGKILAARQQEMNKANELKRLEALTEGDFLASKRMLAEAEGNHEKALLFQKSLETELNGAREQVRSFISGRKAKFAAMETSLAEIISFREAIDAEIASREALLSGRGQEMTLKAGNPGIILQPSATVGQQLRAGDEIFITYQPESVRMIAYVDERFRSQINPGQAARIRIGGQIYNASVRTVHPAPVYPPAQLRNRRVVPENRYFFTVELEMSDYRQLVPGDVGKAVFH